MAILLSFLLGLQGWHAPPLADEIQERRESTYEDHEPREHHVDLPPPATGLEASSMRPGNGGRQRPLSAFERAAVQVGRELATRSM
jgi:hypothetical protein